jgi:hypothetical protein
MRRSTLIAQVISWNEHPARACPEELKGCACE